MLCRHPGPARLRNASSFHCPRLQALVSIHGERGGMAEGFLSPEETSIIQGALDLTSLTARHAMTPLDKVGWRLAC